MIYKVSNQIN